MRALGTHGRRGSPCTRGRQRRYAKAKKRCANTPYRSGSPQFTIAREYAGSSPRGAYPGLADSPWARLYRPRVRELESPRRVPNCFGGIVSYLMCECSFRRRCSRGGLFFARDLEGGFRKRFTSLGVSSRCCPGAKPESVICPMRTRRSFTTEWPTESNIRRICWFLPSRKMTSYHALPASLVRFINRISAGAVRERPSAMPRLNRSI